MIISIVLYIISICFCFYILCKVGITERLWEDVSTLGDFLMVTVLYTPLLSTSPIVCLIYILYLMWDKALKNIWNYKIK